MRDHRLTASVLTVLTAVTLSACGDDNGNGDPTGPGDDSSVSASFAVSISGVISRSLSGESAFHGQGNDPETGESLWGLVLEDGAGRSLVFIRNGQRPGEGRYTLDDSDVDDDLTAGEIGALYVEDAQGQVAAVFASIGGELVITESSSGTLKGTFDFPARGGAFLGGTPQEGTVNISGQFTAVGGPFIPGGI